MSDVFSSRPALLIVDLQAGTLGRGFAPRSAEDCLAAAVTLARQVHRAAGMVIVARSVFAGDLADIPPGPVDRPMPISSSGLPEDWAELPASLTEVADLVVDRPHWNVFHATGLDIALRRRGIKDVILAGLTSNFSIESTARHGWELGYALWFAADAMTSISTESHEFALATTLPRLGRVSTCAALAAALTP